MDRPCEVTVKRLTRHVHSDWLHDAGCWSLVAGCWQLAAETLPTRRVGHGLDRGALAQSAGHMIQYLHLDAYSDIPVRE